MPDALAAAFWEHHQGSTAQSFLAIRGIIRTAIANQQPRDDVAKALDQLAREGHVISGGSLTIALQQVRKNTSGSGNGSSPGKQVNFAPEEYTRGWK